MQVQGSGRVRLPDGSKVRLGYAGKNGHPYTSIGKALVARGEGSPKSMSMQGIKEWLRADPERGRGSWGRTTPMCSSRELTAEAGARRAARGARRGAHAGAEPRRGSAYNALGLPIFVEAEELTHPDGAPFRRLMIAQDVGSAIRGPERGDIFWGSGDEAGAIAGTTLAPAQFIVLQAEAVQPGALDEPMGKRGKDEDDALWARVVRDRRALEGAQARRPVETQAAEAGAKAKPRPATRAARHRADR